MLAARPPAARSDSRPPDIPLPTSRKNRTRSARGADPNVSGFSTSPATARVRPSDEADNAVTWSNKPDMRKDERVRRSGLLARLRAAARGSGRSVDLRCARWGRVSAGDGRRMPPAGLRTTDGRSRQAAGRASARRRRRASRASSSFRSRAAQMSVARPASLSAGATNPIAL